MAKPTSPAPSPSEKNPALHPQQKPQSGAGSTQPRLAASANPSQNPSRRSILMVLGTRKRGHAGGGGRALLRNHSLGRCAPPDPPGHADGGGGVHGNGGSAAVLLDAGHAGGDGPALLGNHSLGNCAPPDPPGHPDGDGGVYGDAGSAATLLDALGLGSFARLDLPVPPDGLDLTAAVQPSDGCIIISMGGVSITASPADLAKALSLPLGTVALAAEDAPLFSSVEAIAAVRVFVHDRLLMGGTGDGQVLPVETVAALQLVEDGMAYAVDWGWFVWALLWSDVLVGNRRRCSPYLLFLLMKCQRPDLFSEVDGRKRKKCTILQRDLFSAALLDALGLGSFARLDLPAPPDGLDLTAAVKPSLGRIIVSMGGDSITASPGDLAKALSLPLGTVALATEDAPLFSSVEAIAALRVFVHDRLLMGGTGDGQELPEETVAALQLVEDGMAYAVDWGWLVWAFLWSDVLVGKRRRCSQYLLFLLMKCQRPDLFSEVYGGFLQKRRKCLILQQEEEKLLHGNSICDQLMAAEAEVQEKLVCGLSKNIGKLDKMAASGYVKDQQQRIETEDGNHDKADVGRPSLPSFYASRQQVLAHLSNMKNAVLEKERTLTHTRAEIQHMKEKVKEKDNQIAYIEKEMQKEHPARLAKISQLEHDKMLMCGTLHGYKKMLRESSAAFQEYRKMVNEGSGVPSLDSVADEKNQIRLMQQQQQQRCAYEIINGLQKSLLSKFSACAKDIRVMLTKLADLNNEVQRLKSSRSVPGLNVV